MSNPRTSNAVAIAVVDDLASLGRYLSDNRLTLSAKRPGRGKDNGRGDNGKWQVQLERPWGARVVVKAGDTFAEALKNAIARWETIKDHF